MGEQHAVSPERPGGDALEQQRIAAWILRSECSEHPRLQIEVAYRHGSAGADQPVKRLKITDPFVPPNPKEFDSAYSIGICRAVLGT